MNEAMISNISDPWFQTLFATNPQPMYIYDAQTLVFLAVNEAAIGYYGYTEDEFLRMTTKELRPAEEVPELLKEIEELLKTSKGGFLKSPVKHHLKKDGTLIYVETAKQLITFKGRQAICVLVNDVTERELAEQKIQHLAYYDELTELPNHAKLRSDLQSAIVKGQQFKKSFAVAIVEMARYREINYTLGHVNGDRLLQQVAQRMRDASGTLETIAYLGNAQFAIILADTTASEAIHIAKQLLFSLEKPFAVEGLNYELDARVGIALFPGHGVDADLLIQHADVAVYQANRLGHEYAIYNASQDPYKPSRLAMLGEFRNAIEHDQLQLYCQPKANIQTGQISSAEALVRWLRPDYGLVLPDTFIPLIEPTELIQPLTQWMLETAISQCYAWRQTGLHIQLAVNLSTRNLLDPSICDSIYDLLQTWGGEVSWLGLEITESSIMTDPVTSKAVLDRLSGMGFKLFVDDYGTGYSSLSYLMKLPMNAIKIDHSFTMAMMEENDAAAIVRSTIEMAHRLGMKVIAEGTANREIWNALAKLGCDEAQGHYISAPMPAKDFAVWLSQYESL